MRRLHVSRCSVSAAKWNSLHLAVREEVACAALATVQGDLLHDGRQVRSIGVRSNRTDGRLRKSTTRLNDGAKLAMHIISDLMHSCSVIRTQASPPYSEGTQLQSKGLTSSMTYCDYHRNFNAHPNPDHRSTSRKFR